jgi:FixJ family two-component response regulator
LLAERVRQEEEFRLVLNRKDGKLQNTPIVSIIDDDQEVRHAVQRLMRSRGFVTRAFASAEEFLRSPSLHETACVISDIQMPGMTGMELHDFMLKQGPRLPVIFLTAFPDERIEKRALQAGALGFLTKPFDAKTLIKLVDSALQNGG